MENEIIEVYRGVPIRKYNKIQIRVSYYEVKKFIDAKKDKRLSPRDVLEILSTPCETCKNHTVTIYDSDNNSKEVKKGSVFNFITKK